MNNISKGILLKLQELEDNPRTPFSFTEEVYYSTKDYKYYKTSFITFDKGLYLWELNYFGGDGRYIPNKVELEISNDFLVWISKFKITNKTDLIKQLLNEDDDVLKLRCERDGKDFVKIRKLIESDLNKCFKGLK